jgi:HlyD family secretion protein
MNFLEKIRAGLKGQIEYKETVSVSAKVIPEAVVSMELFFDSKEDLALQDGLSFGVKLILSEKNKILVPKGSFNQETAGKWLFVVNQSSEKKYKIRQRKSILL